MRTIAAAILLFGLTFSTAVAADPKKPTLRYATSYAEAIAAAKTRNTLVFATFHKDH